MRRFGSAVVVASAVLVLRCTPFGAEKDGASDAGGDAGVTSDAAPGDTPTSAGCKGVKATSCVDFDADPILPAPWTLRKEAGDFRPDGAAYVSAPRSALFAFPRLTQNGGVYDVINATFPAKTLVTVRERVRIDAIASVPEDNSITLTSVIWQSSGYAGGLAVILEADGRIHPAMDVGNGSPSVPPGVAMPLGRWLNLEVRLTAGAQWDASLLLEGNEIGHASGPGKAGVTAILVEVGLERFGTPTAPIEARFDDIVVDAH